jgi:hypothetical protein
MQVTKSRGNSIKRTTARADLNLNEALADLKPLRQSRNNSLVPMFGGQGTPAERRIIQPDAPQSCIHRRGEV